MKPRKRGATSRDEAARRSRELFLDEGFCLLTERLRSPIGAIRAQDVVARTELTTGAFYHHWPNQDAYRESLRSHLGETWDAADPISRFAGTAGSDEQSLSIIELFVSEVESIASDPVWWIEVAMLCSAEPTDVQQVRSHMEGWVASMSGFYSAVVSDLGLTFRAGCSAEMLARSIMAVVDGFSLQARAGLGREPIDDSATSEWGSIEWTVASVICSMVETGEADSQADVRDNWSRMFDESTPTSK